MNYDLHMQSNELRSPQASLASNYQKDSRVGSISKTLRTMASNPDRFETKQQTVRAYASGANAQ